MDNESELLKIAIRALRAERDALKARCAYIERKAYREEGDESWTIFVYDPLCVGVISAIDAVIRGEGCDGHRGQTARNGRGI